MFFRKEHERKAKHSTIQEPILFKYIKEGDVKALIRFLDKHKNAIKPLLEAFNQANETTLHFAAKLFLESDQHMEIFSILMHAAKEAHVDFSIYPQLRNGKKLVDQVLVETIKNFEDDFVAYGKRKSMRNKKLEEKYRRLLLSHVYINSIMTELKDCTRDSMERLVGEYEQRTRNAVNLIESLFLVRFNGDKLTQDFSQILTAIQVSNVNSLKPTHKMDIYKDLIIKKNKLSQGKVSSETSEFYRAVINFVPEDEETLINLDKSIRDLGNHYQYPVHMGARGFSK